MFGWLSSKAKEAGSKETEARKETETESEAETNIKTEEESKVTVTEAGRKDAVEESNVTDETKTNQTVFQVAETISLEKRIRQLEERLERTDREKEQKERTILYYDGTLYVGTVALDASGNVQPNGWGTICYHNGARYIGQWKNGLFHGKGTFYDPYSYIPFTCEWFNHKLVYHMSNPPAAVSYTQVPSAVSYTPFRYTPFRKDYTPTTPYYSKYPTTPTSFSSSYPTSPTPTPTSFRKEPITPCPTSDTAFSAYYLSNKWNQINEMGCNEK